MEGIKKVVIKVGTNVLSDPAGLLDRQAINHLVDQFIEIKKRGIELIVVSSGAVGAGKSYIKTPTPSSRTVQRQVYAATGQIKLMQEWSSAFSAHGYYVAQILATKEDFRDRQHYIHMRNCFEAILRDNIVPIVNENDVIAVEELMFTDNDELAGLVASMINANALFILSNVDGLLTSPPESKETPQVIRKIDPDDKQILKVVFPSRSAFGRGGMHTKIRVARKVAKLGTHCFLVNGKSHHSILETLNGKCPGSHFIASKPISGVKKWMANADTTPSGSVKINSGAENALTSKERVSSLLPIGVINVKGSFEKGDIVKILNQKNEHIGIGLAQYSSNRLQQILGQKGKKPFIHYDYLLII